jgi:Family of unknown function (DUF6152)
VARISAQRAAARASWPLACAVSLFAAAPALAHHSIAGVYDDKQSTRLAGIVTEFRFVNPHPVLIIDVAAGGAPELWELEMDNRFELAQIGVTADTFRPGDHVAVSGEPSRNGEARLYLRRLDRAADGLRYEQVGFRPRIGSAR